jgi:hypothetical protein
MPASQEQSPNDFEINKLKNLYRTDRVFKNLDFSNKRNQTQAKKTCEEVKPDAGQKTIAFEDELQLNGMNTHLFKRRDKSAGQTQASGFVNAREPGPFDKKSPLNKHTIGNKHSNEVSQKADHRPSVSKQNTLDAILKREFPKTEPKSECVVGSSSSSNKETTRKIKRLQGTVSPPPDNEKKELSGTKKESQKTRSSNENTPFVAKERLKSILLSSDSEDLSLDRKPSAEKEENDDNTAELNQNRLNRIHDYIKKKKQSDEITSQLNERLKLLEVPANSVSKLDKATEDIFVSLSSRPRMENYKVEKPKVDDVANDDENQVTDDDGDLFVVEVKKKTQKDFKYTLADASPELEKQIDAIKQVFKNLRNQNFIF